MDKKKLYLGYCGVLLLLLVFEGINLFETDWLFNAALVILCVGQLFTVAAVPTMGRLTSSRMVEEQTASKKPLMSWKLFFLLTLPLILCTAVLTIF